MVQMSRIVCRKICRRLPSEDRAIEVNDIFKKYYKDLTSLMGDVDGFRVVFTMTVGPKVKKKALASIFRVYLLCITSHFRPSQGKAIFRDFSVGKRG